MQLRAVLTEAPRSQQLGLRQVEAQEVTAVIAHGTMLSTSQPTSNVLMRHGARGLTSMTLYVTV
jgi:hypothetical protein